MTVHKSTALLVVGVLMLALRVGAAEPVRVTFINPDNPGNPFWDAVSLFMQAVATDLNIELTIDYGKGNRFGATEAGLAALRRTQKPHYLVYIYQVGQGEKLLSGAEQAGVHSFIFNTDIPLEDRAAIRYPGERFKHWIGHMVPNDIQAGYDLAEKLIQARLQMYPQEEIELVGFTGSRDSSASLDRSQGLSLALERYPQVKLRQLVFANWSRDQVLRQMPFLLARYPDISVIWAASDEMAFGALQGLRNAGRSPGIQFIAGGIDWTDEGIQAVAQSRLGATVGGHFMDGGWVLVMLYDHYHGKPIAGENATLRSKMQAVTPANVHAYLDRFARRPWNQIAFKRFTKTHNPLLAEYDFSLEALLNAPSRRDTGEAQ